MIRGTVALMALPVVLAGQERQLCTWDANRQTNVRTASGQYNTYFGGNVVMRCPAKQITLRSDSLEYYGDEGRVFVLGNVRYSEPRLDVDSDFMTYFQRDERIVANGNVFARLPNRSTMRGPVAEYFRAIPGSRPVPRLVAAGRPTITVVQRDSAGQTGPPMTVVANNVTMVGDSLVYAGGSVVVTREEIVARADSMALDSEREIAVLMRQPSIEGRRDRPFTLAGERIEMTSRARELERVIAKGRARAVSQDLTLTSDTIDLRITDDLLQRAVAWGPSRATAFSPAQRILADSIDVRMPAQRIREMHAVGGAAAQGQPDTTRFRADTVDWMRGDTIIARFDTAATGDTTRAARIRELIAQGAAKAYYHLAPADTTLDRPAINYVIGREILVAFEEQRVARVTVIDQAGGVYLEPNAGVAAAAPAAVAPAAAAPTSSQPRPSSAPSPPPPAAPRRRPPS